MSLGLDLRPEKVSACFPPLCDARLPQSQMGEQPDRDFQRRAICLQLASARERFRGGLRRNDVHERCVPYYLSTNVTIVACGGRKRSWSVRWATRHQAS